MIVSKRGTVRHQQGWLVFPKHESGRKYPDEAKPIGFVSMRIAPSGTHVFKAHTDLGVVTDILCISEAIEAVRFESRRRMWNEVMIKTFQLQRELFLVDAAARVASERMRQLSWSVLCGKLSAVEERIERFKEGLKHG